MVGFSGDSWEVNTYTTLWKSLLVLWVANLSPCSTVLLFISQRYNDIHGAKIHAEPKEGVDHSPSPERKPAPA